MTLADRMAVFMDGKIVQVGTPKAVFDKPATTEVANFIGSPPMNLIDGSYLDGVVKVGEYALQSDCKLLGQKDVVVGIRPSSIRISQTGIPARIDLIENLGDALLVDLNVYDDLVRAKVDTELTAREGDTVFLSADPSHIHLFAADTHMRLSEGH